MAITRFNGSAGVDLKQWTNVRMEGEKNHDAAAKKLRGTHTIIIGNYRVL